MHWAIPNGRRYSQIEKEALVIAWACEKFYNYILGKPIHLKTVHKPLIPLLNPSNLNSLPAQVLRFRLRLSRFDYTINHFPGKLIYTADTISYAPIGSTCSTHSQEEVPTEFFVSALVSTLSAGQDHLHEYQTSQQDSTCCHPITYCQQGWPTDVSSKDISHLIGKWEETSAIMTTLTYTAVLSLFPRACKPQYCRRSTMGIKAAHYLICMVAWAAREIMPNLYKVSTLHKEPLMYSPLPNRPWEKVGSDLFELNGSTYLLILDYFSRFIKIQKLSSINSRSVILALKAIFSRHELAATLASVNDPQ